jgi:holliday junction DNA helicase RuvA
VHNNCGVENNALRIHDRFLRPNCHLPPASAGAGSNPPPHAGEGTKAIEAINAFEVIKPINAVTTNAKRKANRKINMIGRLKGSLIHKQPPWLVLDVHGVGYELEAPMSTFYDLPEVGREVSLFTHYAVKEDSVALYGFMHENERRLFRDVQKVSGIGAKIALAILSGSSVDEFARLVQSGDVTALCRIPGIGKKTAERIVVELRDRAADLMGGGGLSMGANAGPADPVSEASIALQQLGYKPVEISRLLKVAEAGDSAEDIIRKALKSALKS